MMYIVQSTLQFLDLCIYLILKKLFMSIEMNDPAMKGFDGYAVKVLDFINESIKIRKVFTGL
ncbi:hypothetical protein [Cytobacillus oceanisediminis]|uniref:Uncharacterized protein n=1 Tax=Cytobacillus oceanisediminis 2691 TaxID=1196031 RepID=A0A160MGH2_9BACI|nr:hypothetical protein [Cytobacillus oceanisediminis]AND42396.1 hypothetical protein A361_25660 [Cytobacillus oceanisediminis 2691]MCM3243995.1 hypothetical protein [Cytobacillus oceanisediminis]